MPRGLSLPSPAAERSHSLAGRGCVKEAAAHAAMLAAGLEPRGLAKGSLIPLYEKSFESQLLSAAENVG